METLRLICNTANNSKTFLLNEKMFDIPDDLAAGDKVIVECEFYTDEEKPYSAIMVTHDD